MILSIVNIEDFADELTHAAYRCVFTAGPFTSLQAYKSCVSIRRIIKTFRLPRETTLSTRFLYRMKIQKHSNSIESSILTYKLKYYSNRVKSNRQMHRPTAGKRDGAYILYVYKIRNVIISNRRKILR